MTPTDLKARLREAGDTQALAYIERLEVALKPFADHDVGTIAREGPFSIPDGHPLLGTGLGNDWKPSVTVGDFRRARDTLKDTTDA